MDPIAQRLLAARPRGLEKLQADCQRYLVCFRHSWRLSTLGFSVATRERATTLPVRDPEAALQGGPAVALDPPVREPRERVPGDFFHRGERPVLVEHAAGHFPLIAEQSLVQSSRMRHEFDAACEPAGVEPRHRLDEHLGVADLRQRPTGVAEATVLFTVDLVAEILAHQAAERPAPS